MYRRVEDNSLFYPPYQVVNAINEALRTLNLFTGYYQATATVGVSVAGRFFYYNPVSIIFALEVYIDRRMLYRSPLSSTARARTDFLRADTLQDGDPLFWIPLGTSKFIVTPADTLGGRALEVVGVSEPPLLISGTDISVLADDWLELVENYAFYTLTFTEGGKIFADASKLFQHFQRRMKDLQIWTTMTNPRYFVEQESPR